MNNSDNIVTINSLPKKFSKVWLLFINEINNHFYLLMCMCNLINGIRIISHKDKTKHTEATFVYCYSKAHLQYIHKIIFLICDNNWHFISDDIQRAFRDECIALTNDRMLEWSRDTGNCSQIHAPLPISFQYYSLAGPYHCSNERTTKYWIQMM